MSTTRPIGRANPTYILGVDSRTQAVIAITKIGGPGDWPRPN